MQTWRTPVQRSGPESNNEFRWAIAFYSNLIANPTEPPVILDDSAYAKWREWYGNGQLKQFLASHKVEAGNDIPTTVSKNANDYKDMTKITYRTNIRVDSQVYSRDMTFVKDPANGYWYVDSFDPIK